MKQLRIQKPCTEQWGDMTPTAQGAFCSQCAKNVIDLSSSSHTEIRKVMEEAGDIGLCARIRRSQLDSFNEELRQWQQSSPRTFQSALVFSLVVVFGLALFSCSNEKEQKAIREIQTIGQMISEPEPKTVEEVKGKARELAPVTVEAQPTEMVFGEVQAVDPVQDPEVMNVPYMEQMILGGIAFHYVDPVEIVLPDQITEYDEHGNEIPKVFASLAYPNPASEHTTLEVSLPQGGVTDIALYDLSGKLVRPVFSGALSRGTHAYPVEVAELPAGMYLFVVRSGSYSETVRIIKN